MTEVAPEIAQSIQIENCTARFSETFSLYDIDWQLSENQHWAILGPNGSGKSALAALLAGEGEIEAGQVSGLPKKVELVSFESQAELIERERELDDGRGLLGTSVAELLAESCPDDFSNKLPNKELLSDLVEKFELTPLLQRKFRKLSTGETRKVLLIRALASQADLIVLDEPFDGLDADSRKLLVSLLNSIKDQVPIVMIMNRYDEVPDFVDHFLYMEDARIHLRADVTDPAALTMLEQLLHLKTSELSFPEADETASAPALAPDDPLVRIKAARVAYGDKIIFDKLNWQVDPGEHWQLTGPNGSGKTCLLNLITGDHPQCYVNDIFVFGYQRGQGESIWQIKQHIGYVSTALQWEYRVSTHLLNVVLSGFYDSIGLYEKATERQTAIAKDWLAVLGMSARWDQPFTALSYGEQRLVLIARALVKQPDLLILDEPCLGLDDANRALVLALIEQVCQKSNTTVIYVNHHAEDSITGIDRHLSLSPPA